MSRNVRELNELKVVSATKEVAQSCKIKPTASLLYMWLREKLTVDFVTLLQI